MAVLMVAKLCNANTRRGKKCGRPKGWGTDHPGSGRCKFHGGASPNGRKAAAKELAATWSAGMLGARVSTSPLDGMQESVDLSAGIVEWYRRELLEAAAKIGTDEEEAGRRRIDDLRRDFEESVKRHGELSKGATLANVAERRARIVETQGELIAGVLLSCVRAVFGEELTRARQAALARELRSRFEELESGVVEGRALPA